MNYFVASVVSSYRSLVKADKSQATLYNLLLPICCNITIIVIIIVIITEININTSNIDNKILIYIILIPKVEVIVLFYFPRPLIYLYKIYHQIYTQ